MRLIAHLESGNAVMWYVGIADNTDWTRVSLPALDNIRPFHPGSLAPILSMSTCSASLRNLPMYRSRPKYLHGNSAILPWKCYEILTLAPSHLILYISDFCILVTKPEAFPKNCKIC